MLIMNFKKTKKVNIFHQIALNSLISAIFFHRKGRYFLKKDEKTVLGTTYGEYRTQKLFTDRIYKIYTDFYFFLFTMFIPVNPVFFKLIINYPQHAIRNTHYAIRTKNAVSRRFFENYLDVEQIGSYNI